MKHFLAISDLTSEEVQDLLDVAIKLKEEYFKKGNPPYFKGKVLAMIFQKPSLRTRVSFDMAMRHCGGDALYLSPNEIGLGKRESIADIARVMSGYVHALMARTFDHAHVLELAKWSEIPVVNGLSDYNHPCQGLADALTIQEKFGKAKGLNVSYVGDANNVANSWMNAAVVFGFEFILACPHGYEPHGPTYDRARAAGAKVTVTHDAAAAAAGADVLYADVWTSMGQEDEAEQRRRDFSAYQINGTLLRRANRDAVVMHCLPAHRGEEITGEVIDGPQSIVFDQAENRLHTQKAIMAWLMKVLSA